MSTNNLSIISCPDDNHPHIIDLGLPSGTKWSCCNVGAETPEDYGGYFAWGETEEKDNYGSNYYLYREKNEINYNIGEDISRTQYDVAYVKWGDDWQLPTKDQIDELKNNCAYVWTTVNDINGKIFIGPNERSIFLPAAGISSGWQTGSIGGYWSSTQYAPHTNYHYWNAYALLFDSERNHSFGYNYANRENGLSVRPVVRKR